MEWLQNFFNTVTEWWNSNDALANASGLLNTGLVTAGLVFYNKYVAPKLAKMKIVSSEFAAITALVDKLDKKLETALGANLELKQDMYVLRDAFGVAFANSNLDTQSKALLQEVLNGVMNNEKIEVRDNITEMNVSSKQAINELMAKAKELANENKRTAIAALQARIAEVAKTATAQPTTGTNV